MASDWVERKLAAIMFTDIVGSKSLTGSQSIYSLFVETQGTLYG